MTPLATGIALIALGMLVAAAIAYYATRPVRRGPPRGIPTPVSRRGLSERLDFAPDGLSDDEAPARTWPPLSEELGIITVILVCTLIVGVAASWLAPLVGACS